MILLSFAGFLRFVEISSLLCSDVKIECDYLFIFIRKSTTDQYRNGNEVLIAKGETIACPLSMFTRYVELSGVNLDSDFYIFRPIFRSKGTCKLIQKNKKLSYTAARESIVSRLRLVSIGLKLGLHSMRTGGATAAANFDINDRVWKRHGRQTSDSSKDGYVVDSVDKRLHVSKNIGLQFSTPSVPPIFEFIFIVLGELVGKIILQLILFHTSIWAMKVSVAICRFSILCIKAMNALLAYCHLQTLKYIHEFYRGSVVIAGKCMY